MPKLTFSRTGRKVPAPSPCSILKSRPGQHLATLAVSPAAAHCCGVHMARGPHSCLRQQTWQVNAGHGTREHKRERGRASLFTWDYVFSGWGGTRNLFKIANQLPTFLWACFGIYPPSQRPFPQARLTDEYLSYVTPTALCRHPFPPLFNPFPRWSAGNGPWFPVECAVVKSW